MTNKDKIVNTAIRLFYQFGYKGTSVDTLVKEAGVSKSNFYYYFRSKEELGLKTVEILAERQLKFLSEILKNPDVNPVERFVLCYKKTLLGEEKQVLHPLLLGSFFGNLALEQSAINDKFRFALDDYFQKCEEILEESLKEGLQQGVFHEKVDPKAVAKVFLSLFEGAMIRVKTGGSTAPLEAIYKEATKLVKDEWLYLTELEQ